MTGTLAVPESAAVLPISIVSLERVVAVPYLLVGVLSLLGLTAMAHNLVSTARERHFDVGVIRALGAEGGQLRTAVHCQAMVDAMIVLLIGLPVGVMVGRFVFALVADRVGVVPEARLAFELVPVLIVGLVGAMNLAALAPGHHASRTPTGDLISERWRR